MHTKLTLTIEESIIEQAKKYAKHKNKSLSRIVEEYLSHLIGIQSTETDTMESPITDQLVGMFRDDGRDYETMLDEARRERLL